MENVDKTVMRIVLNVVKEEIRILVSGESLSLSLTAFFLTEEPIVP